MKMMFKTEGCLPGELAENSDIIRHKKQLTVED